jgi:hypothetical protein
MTSMTVAEPGTKIDFQEEDEITIGSSGKTDFVDRTEIDDYEAID